MDYYGFESEEVLLGKTDEDMGWHSNPDPFQNDECRVLYQGESTYRVHGKCMARGEERDILASKSPIYDDGRIIGLVGTFEDVTREYAQNNQIRKLMQTIEAVPCGICICKRYFDRTICISANGYFTDLIGGTPENFVGKDTTTLIGVIHPDDRGRWMQDAAALYTGQQPMDGIYRFRQQGDEVYTWLRMKGCKTRLPEDEELIYFAFTDENDLKNSQDYEKALKRLYAASVEAAKLVVWEYDVAAHSVTFSGEGFTARRCQELGLPQVFENVPEALYPLLPQDSHEALRRLYEDVGDGKPWSTEEIRYIPGPEQAPMFLRLSYMTLLDERGRASGLRHGAEHHP